jgi:hypothetical protein
VKESTFEQVLFGKDGFDFFDLLDIINPLQHIPFVSSLYRQITGDELGAAPRVLGGALFGGPIGAGAALANAVVEGQTGKDLGEHAIAWVNDEPAAGELRHRRRPRCPSDRDGGNGTWSLPGLQS